MTGVGGSGRRRCDRGREAVAVEEVCRRWAALSVEQRQAVFQFDDPVLLDRVRSSLQALYEKQALMEQLGLGGGGPRADPFESSVLLKEAFHFSWSIARSKHQPNVVMIDPVARAVLAVKPEYLATEDIVGRVREAVPEFVTQQARHAQIPRARWKEFFAAEAASLAQLERQLSQLLEQALLAMATDPAYRVEVAEEAPLGNPSGEVAIEAWMLDHDEEAAKAGRVAKRKKAKKPTEKTSKPLEPMVEETARQMLVAKADERPAMVLQQHYWGKRASPAVSAAAAPPPSGDNVTLAEGAGRAEKVVEPPAPAAVLTQKEERETVEEAKTPTSTDNHAALESSDGDSWNMVVRGRYVSMPPQANRTEDALERGARPPEEAWESASEACTTHDRTVQPPSCPGSPRLPSKGTWQPGQLVNYMWGRMSQIAREDSESSEKGEQRCTPTAVSGSSSALSSTALSTPLRRGQWSASRPQTPSGDVFCAVTRNTFIDVDVCAESLAPQRKTRSLSPRLRARGAGGAGGAAVPAADDPDHEWYWYWH